MCGQGGEGRVREGRFCPARVPGLDPPPQFNSAGPIRGGKAGPASWDQVSPLASLLQGLAVTGGLPQVLRSSPSKLMTAGVWTPICWGLVCLEQKQTLHLHRCGDTPGVALFVSVVFSHLQLLKNYSSR